MILTAKFGEANHELFCDFSITAQKKIENYTGDYGVDITENGTTTLLTAGKFCDRDIDVNVNIPTGEELADGLIDGTLSGAYRNDRVTEVKAYRFSDCKNLTGIDLPNVTVVNKYAFSACTNLVDVNIPKVTSLGTQAFGDCSALKTIDLPSVSSFAAVFQGCNSLRTLILRITSVCTLLSTSAFRNCYHFLGTVNATYNPEGLKDGYIYVPDNLVEDYKVATNWSTYASQIKPISELEE